MLLSLPIFAPPPLVAAAQNIGLIGATLVVAVGLFLEAVDR